MGDTVTLSALQIDRRQSRQSGIPQTGCTSVNRRKQTRKLTARSRNRKSIVVVKSYMWSPTTDIVSLAVGSQKRFGQSMDQESTSECPELGSATSTGTEAEVVSAALNMEAYLLEKLRVNTPSSHSLRLPISLKNL